MDCKTRGKIMVRIGIVGAGKICQGPHMGAYDKIDNAEIVAICDIDEKKLESVGKRYPNAKLYTDYREMIQRETLDAVDICTPNVLHSEIAIYALNNGLHVICEKPDAINVAEAEKMKEASEKNGKVFQAVAVKLNGTIFKAGKVYMSREAKSYNYYKEKAYDYWNQKDLKDEEVKEVLFEGTAEIVTILDEVKV